MKLISKILLFACLACFACLPAQAQTGLNSYREYIRKYHPLAIEHARKYKIPASIKLAQGLLESGGGTSELARKSNNHFGIKCHTTWQGDRTFHADDGPNDCFRVYACVEDSYDDHSRFLSERKRYEALFSYEITDYKKWARGLQQCGYATNKAYANKLIKLIEDYELYQYDDGKFIESLPAEDIKPADKTPLPEGSSGERPVYKKSGLLYTTALHGDSFESVSQATGYKLKDLLKYNEAPADFPLQDGDIIYLQKKKAKADKPNFDHVVQMGESMHSISQTYGVQLSSLYKINKKQKDYIPEEGDVIRLR